MLSILLVAAETSDLPNWTSLVSSIANVGFAVVVGYYLLTKALPDMQSRFSLELKGQREDFTSQIEAQRQEFSAQDKEKRLDFKESLTFINHSFDGSLSAVIKHCEQESIRTTETLKSELDNLNLVVKDNREVMEEVRKALEEFCEELKLFRGFRNKATGQ